MLAICEWGDNKPWRWPDRVGQLWHTNGDIADNWASLMDNVDRNLRHAQYAGPATGTIRISCRSAAAA